MTTTTEQMREALQYVFDKMYVDNNTGNWALESDFDDNVLHSALAAAPAPTDDECKTIVKRIWGMLGSPSYEQLAGRSIYDLISELQSSAATAPQLEAAQPAPVPVAQAIADYLKSNAFKHVPLPDQAGAEVGFGHGYAFALNTHQVAAPAQQEQAPNNYHDAYRGARDDMQEWKKRALEAEESCRRLTQVLNEQNGPTLMGEPFLKQAPQPMTLSDEDLTNIKRALDYLRNSGGSNSEKKRWADSFERAISITQGVQPMTDEQLQVAINTCRDVTTTGRFAAGVDPVRWVEQLQAHLESVTQPAQKDLMAVLQHVLDADSAHVSDTMKDIVRHEIAGLLSRHPAQPVNPVAYAVFDGNEPVYCASYSTACQEHINDAINEFHVEGAEKWRVVPLYAAPVSQDIASLKEQNAELVKDAERYRWLREHGIDWLNEQTLIDLDYKKSELDSAIDAEIASAHQENKQ